MEYKLFDTAKLCFIYLIISTFLLACGSTPTPDYKDDLRQQADRETSKLD